MIAPFTRNAPAIHRLLLASLLLVTTSLLSLHLHAQAPAAGSLDPGFNVTIRPSTLDVIRVQPDGKILLGGIFSSAAGQANNGLARLNTDGSLDDAFAARTNPYGNVSDVAIQPDGKLVLAGAFNRFNGVRCGGIARLNADGTLDNAFSDSLQFTDAPTEFRAVAVQTDGKIVAAGSFIQFDGVARHGIFRFNPDCTLDPDFNASFEGGVTALVLQADGKILVSGQFQVSAPPRHNLARLNADGTLDDTFQADVPGVVVIAMALQPDGRVVVGGQFEQVNGVPHIGLARVNADGSLDGAFNPDVEDVFNDGVRPGYVVDLARQPDGRIVLSGEFNQVGGVPSGYVARLNADGSVDRTFQGSTDDTVYAVALQPADGKIILNGAFGQVNGVSHFVFACLFGGPSGPMPAPVLLDGQTTAPVGRPFIYQVAATNVPTSYAATGLPDGLGLNPTTGVISGTPTTLGAFPVALSATNAAGTGRATLTIRVAVPAAPTPAPAVSVVGNPGRGGFVISRVDSQSVRALTVRFHHGGSAVINVDYYGLSDSVTLEAGQTETVVAIRLLPGANLNHKVKLFLDPAAEDGRAYDISKAQSKVYLSDLR